MPVSSERRRWYQGVSPGLTGKFFGGLIAIGVVFPIIGMTLLERSLGEAGTVAVIIGLFLASALGVVALFVKKRPVEAWTCASLLVGLGLALYIVLSYK